MTETAPRLPRTTYRARQAWLGMALTGAMFLVTVVSFAWLFIFGGVYFLERWALVFMRQRFFDATLLSGAAFFAAMITAWWRRACRTALACFLAYAVVLIFVVGGFGRVLELETTIMLLAPLITAPLGGWLGERIRDQR